MRMLDTRTFTFTDVNLSASIQRTQGQSQAPTHQYAILSHRWFSQEATFRHVEAGTYPKSVELGLAKIKTFCRIAKDKYGLSLAWSDTCCIDKSSSAELTESINAMWHLYKNSTVCIVYLSDVIIPTDGTAEQRRRSPQDPGDRRDRGDPRDGQNLQVPSNRPTRARSDPGARRNDLRDNIAIFKRSEWFRRGWTLQELLAPSNVQFYDKNWQYLGDRRTLEQAVESVTGIRHINNPNTIRDASIAERMSWAAWRETTRAEDTAYCLLGLFNISLPIIYGEGGDRAFYRLQTEIIKEYDDESIFAWDQRDGQGSGMLASNPRQFANSYDIVRFDSYGFNRPFSITNKGLQMHCFAKVVKEYSEGRREKERGLSGFFSNIFDAPPRGTMLVYTVPLNCRRENSDSALCVTLSGFPNEPRVYRRGKLKKSQLSMDHVKVTLEDYDDWFQDFYVPQDPSWAIEPAKRYLKGKFNPKTFDDFERDLLSRSRQRQMEDVTKRKMQAATTPANAPPTSSGPRQPVSPGPNPTTSGNAAN